jgi:ribonuclease-3
VKTRDWIVKVAEPDISAETAPLSLKSPKSRLQEHTQRSTGGRPSYRVLEATGPDHEKHFTVEVAVDGVVLGAGSGLSRRIAETEAAAQALEALKRRDPSGPVA